MKWRYLFLLAGIMAMSLGQAQEVFSPSFNCDRASTWAEKSICGDALLASLDVEMDAIYGSLRNALSAEARNSLRSEQRAWLLERERCEAQFDAQACLLNLIFERKQNLWQARLAIGDLGRLAAVPLEIASSDTLNFWGSERRLEAISLEKDNRLQQYLSAKAEDFDVANSFVIEDMNFDGYNDLRVREFLPAGANIPYLYWLYQPAIERFIANQALSQLTSPNFDQTTGIITSAWRSSAASYGQDSYRYQEGQLLLIRQETFDYLQENTYRYRLFERLDGEMSLVKQRFETVE
ncbi:MAG: lysozyme inhibitor LprI family protein [Deinococcales bacterium]